MIVIVDVVEVVVGAVFDVVVVFGKLVVVVSLTSVLVVVELLSMLVLVDVLTAVLVVVVVSTVLLVVVLLTLLVVLLLEEVVDVVLVVVVTGVHTLGSPLHSNPASTAQAPSQPSPGSVLTSSQLSPTSMTPSPQEAALACTVKRTSAAARRRDVPLSISRRAAASEGDSCMTHPRVRVSVETTAPGPRDQQISLLTGN
jgi:hypothetical protein